MKNSRHNPYETEYEIYKGLILSTIDDSGDLTDLIAYHVPPKMFFEFSIHPWYVSQLTAELDEDDYYWLNEFLYAVFKLGEVNACYYTDGVQLRDLTAMCYEDSVFTVKADPYHKCIGVENSCDTSYTYYRSLEELVAELTKLADMDDDGRMEWERVRFYGE